MKVEFDWHADGEGETIAQTERRRRFRVPRWVGRVARILPIAILVAAAAGYLGMRARYAWLRDRARARIEEVIEVQRWALEQGDAQLYLSQQDADARAWYAWQKEILAQRRQGAKTQGGEGAGTQGGALSIEEVELRGDVAWVEVVERDVRRVRFYRRVAPASVGAPGWQETAPRAAFWGEPAEARTGDLIVHYYQRDEPYVRALLPHLEKVARAAVADLRYGLAGRMVIVYLNPEQIGTEQPPADVPDGISYLRREVSLPSPWVSGVPADGVWDGPWLAAAAYDLTHALAQRALYSASETGLNPLQRALADEYAAWISQGRDPAQAPLLRRVVERQGEEALPVMFLSLKNTRVPALFAAQWLSLYPYWEGTAFFETAMNVEREALLAGRKETFLLFQAPGERTAAGAWYETRPALDLPPVQVVSVEMGDGLARVRVRTPEEQWDAWRRCVPAETGAQVCEDEEWWDWMQMQRVGRGRAGLAE